MTCARVAAAALALIGASAQSPTRSPTFNPAQAPSATAPPAPVASPTPVASPAPVRATFAPCPTPRPQFAAIAVDAAPPVEVLTTQQFVIALRTVADDGTSWSLLSGAAKGSGVRSDGARTLNDTAFQNLNAPGQPPQTSGNATELWLFTALAPGTTTLVFGLMLQGTTAPTRTTTYTVRVSPNVTIC